MPSHRLIRDSALTAAALAWAALTACVSPFAPPCPPPASQPAAELSSALYEGDGDSFARGPLSVRTIEIERCQSGAPTAMQIHAPVDGEGYPLVIFQHGFQSRNRAYEQILTHVASHGFVVVAPQMYAPGVASLFSDFTAQDEARLAADVLQWLPERIDALSGTKTRWDRLGLAGHSRGGKVVWLVLRDNPNAALAAAGIDPVDGRGGPSGDQPRVLDAPVTFAGPSVILGAGLGGDCAPEGENHVQFFAAAQSPAMHVVAPGQGHGDMLDPFDSRLATLICESGSTPDEMRQLTAGLMVLLFREALQDQPGQLQALAEGRATPLPVETEIK
jgi:chlorophyllase